MHRSTSAIVLLLSLLLVTASSVAFFIIQDKDELPKSLAEYQVEGKNSWNQILALLNSGMVKKVRQSHDLNIEITLKNGDIINIRENEIDDIFHAIDNCGKTCEDIIKITE